MDEEATKLPAKYEYKNPWRRAFRRSDAWADVKAILRTVGAGAMAMFAMVLFDLGDSGSLRFEVALGVIAVVAVIEVIVLRYRLETVALREHIAGLEATLQRVRSANHQSPTPELLAQLVSAPVHSKPSGIRGSGGRFVDPVSRMIGEHLSDVTIRDMSVFLGEDDLVACVYPAALDEHGKPIMTESWKGKAVEVRWLFDWSRRNNAEYRKIVAEQVAERIRTRFKRNGVLPGP